MVMAAMIQTVQYSTAKHSTRFSVGLVEVGGGWWYEGWFGDGEASLKVTDLKADQLVVQREVE